MSEYDAVVYDLDGTLVDLQVNWARVTSDVRAVYESAGIQPPATDLWGMLEGAADAGLVETVESTIADHEREGARGAPRLPHADELLERSVPVGVCSLNCEAACRIAIDDHGLEVAVEAVIGRDTVSRKKPHPEPLLEAVERLGSDPQRALFIGDSPRDERTAQRAGTDFAYVRDGLALE